MLFQDLRIAPAPGPIELGHHHAPIFQKHLEDAVFIRVQLQQPAVAAQAHGIEGIEHRFRSQAGEGRRLRVLVALRLLRVVHGPEYRTRRARRALRPCASVEREAHLAHGEPGAHLEDAAARRLLEAQAHGERGRLRGPGGGELGRVEAQDEAVAAYTTAIDRATNTTERRFLTQRRAALDA